MDEELLIPLVAVLSLFVVLPGMVFHYITKWRNQKTIQPDDERMLEDLWRSARRMEARIETLERLIARDGPGAGAPQPPPAPSSSSPPPPSGRGRGGL